ncbi:hypothetical protein VT52_013555 [Streptomyces malaysiense]|uniref:Uncharacterized protein n=1 Tax=Streptomyces malaysiense TaxID=1428626 RepID=A0A1J4Q368_9ACTN|nr:hypothetical protein VT52_013555 [Streptomyces malaysiense]
MAEGGGLEPADLVAMAGVVASTAPERDVSPGRRDVGAQKRGARFISVDTIFPPVLAALEEQT